MAASDGQRIAANPRHIPGGQPRHLQAGRIGEDKAVEFLRRRGYRILERNFRTPVGELDVIALTPAPASAVGCEVVFAEVKWRRSPWDGAGLAAITPRKLRAMRRAAAQWLREQRENRDAALPSAVGVQAVATGVDARFDIIDIGPDGVREHLEGVW